MFFYQLQKLILVYELCKLYDLCKLTKLCVLCKLYKYFTNHLKSVKIT